MTADRSDTKPSTRRRGAHLLSVAAVIAVLIALLASWGQLSVAEAEGGAGAPVPAAEPVREVLLLVDASRDLDPETAELLRAASYAALDELGPRDLFNVIAFGSRPRALYPGSWPASRQSRDKARRFVASLEPGGERSVVTAAEAALAPTPEGYRPARIARGSDTLPRRVLLLTSRPADDAAALADLRRRLPPAVRLELVPATPAATGSVRSLLRASDPPATAVAVLPAGGQPGSAGEPSGAPPASASADAAQGTNRALLAAALALPLFLVALGWTVRRGLSSGPVSG